MQAPQLFHIDAFTQTPFRGNPAGVVLFADTLTASQMQDLARELKHSETAFVMSPIGNDHDVYIRYFTPTTEVPICGHATIAAHYARAKWLGLNEQHIRQKTGAGIQTIDIHRTTDDYRITMHQGAPSFSEVLDVSICKELTGALGLVAADLIQDLPVQIVSTGHGKVIIPIKEHVNLDNLIPNEKSLCAISARIGCNGYFPFQLRPSDTQATYGRMFAPAIGISEDPVTGNANGPLGAYLVRYGLMQHDGYKLEFKGYQGHALRRDGVVHVSVEIDANHPTSVSIQGDAVILFLAELPL